MHINLKISKQSTFRNGGGSKKTKLFNYFLPKNIVHIISCLKHERHNQERIWQVKEHEEKPLPLHQILHSICYTFRYILYQDILEKLYI
jgi:hypothetical protein